MHADDARDAATPRRQLGGPLVLAAFTAFITYWHRAYLTAAPLPSVDLAGHIAVVERLAAQLPAGRLFFFDRGWFTGWPVSQFYGFVPHLAAALLSWPLRAVTDDPARFAVHLTLVAGCALLPWAMAFAAAPLVDEACGGRRDLRERLAPLAAAVVGTLTFWYLNHDGQMAGIGAAAALQIGLYPQLFAWHLVLLHAGCLYRLLRDEPPATWRPLALCAALLPLTHTMTAVFSFGLAALAWARFPDRRRALLGSHTLALGMIGCWLVPFVATVSPYTLLQIERPDGDLLQQLFRYPLGDLLASLAFRRGAGFAPLDPTPIALLALTGALLAHRAVRRCAVLSTFAVFTLIAALLSSSRYVAASVPLGLHYYRFVAYLLLLSLQLLAVVPVALAAEASLTSDRQAVGARIIVWVATVLCLAATTQLPHPLRQLMRDPHVRELAARDARVLEYFRGVRPKGRVFFEYFRNYRTFPMITPHQLPARLLEATGFESLNGLFIQNSLAFQFPVASARALGIDTYGAPYFLTDQPMPSDGASVQQLAAFGVTHLVLSEPAGLARVRAFAREEPVTIGPYTIVKIADPAPRAAPIGERLIGYLDLRGTLPFKFVEGYFIAREALSRVCDVVELDASRALPPGLAAVLVNGDAADAERALSAMSARGTRPAERPRVLTVSVRGPVAINNDRPRYSLDPEGDAYRRAVEDLDAVVPLAELTSGDRPPPAEPPPTFAWEPDGQSFRLSGLTPGRLVRINYSFFPYWRTTDGELYRGGGERIFLLPTGAEARVTYARFSVASTWLGLAATLISGYLFWRAGRRGWRPGH